MTSVRSLSSLLFPCAVISVLFAGCGGCGDPLFDNFTPFHDHQRVNEPLPDGSDGASVEIVDVFGPSETEPADLPSFGFEYRGGPITQIRLGIGEQYFDMKVDSSRASEAPWEQESDRDIALVRVAQDAAPSEGYITIEGEMNAFHFPSDATESSFSFQASGSDGVFTRPSAEKTVILCTVDEDCTPGGEGGGGGGAIASCSDGNVCSEILEGDASAYEKQCSVNGQTGSLGPCPSSYKGGPSCLGGMITSQGQPVKANMFWRPGYCADFPHIDTYGTCTLDLGGDPGSQSNHCQAP